MHFDGDDAKKREFLRYGILAFERLKISEKLESIDNDDLISDLLRFGEVFADLQEIEASLYWEIANERVKVIRSLADSCDTNAKEKVLQKHIYDNLWLLNPSWERATRGSERLEQSVAKEFKDLESNLSEEERTGRLDIRYRNTSGVHVIVELKRYQPTYKVDVYDLHRQIDKYRNALKKCLKAIGRENEPITAICIIGEGVLPPEMSLEEANNKLAGSGRIITYDMLIHNALESYSEYLEREAKVGKLRALIDQI